LAHSYYEYKFIDEAFSKALHTFEMAMRIRCGDFSIDTKYKGFSFLIKRLSALNLFDTSFDTLEHLRSTRNHFAHPERHGFGGNVYWNRIEIISRLINEMYEDVGLRRERQELGQQLIARLEKAKMNIGLIMEIQGKLHLLYKIQLLLINNKQTPHTYLFACTPVFSLKQGAGTSITLPFVFKSKLIAPILADMSLVGQSFSAKQKVTFKPVMDYPEMSEKFSEWLSAFEGNKNKWRYESGINFSIPDIFIPEVREFQRM